MLEFGGRGISTMLTLYQLPGLCNHGQFEFISTSQQLSRQVRLTQVFCDVTLHSVRLAGPSQSEPARSSSLRASCLSRTWRVTRMCHHYCPVAGQCQVDRLGQLGKQKFRCHGLPLCHLTEVCTRVIRNWFCECPMTTWFQGSLGVCPGLQDYECPKGA